MNKTTLGSLIVVLLIAGCTDPFGFFQPQGPQVKELPPDVLSIQNITTLPSSSVRERDQFSVYFELMNQDEFNETNVIYNLYDTGLCSWKGGEPNSESGNFMLAPQEVKSVEWNFKAPSSEQMANLRVTCPIRFKFDFDYQAKSQIDILVANAGHLIELQRSGKSTTFSPTVNVGRGPIKIYFDFGTSLPVKNNSDLTVYVKVEDKGTGLLKEIGDRNFTITFPEGFIVPDKACPYFSCTGSTSSGRICTNDQPIPIISKKSLDIRCSDITTPSETIEKTYFIGATLNYGYYVTGEADIEVKPE